MIFLQLTQLGGEVEASLTTRRPHPSTASWTWVFPLDEGTDPGDVQRRQGDRLTLLSTSARVHTLGGQSVMERKRAVLHLMAQHPIEVQQPALVHHVLVDLAKSGESLRHRVDVADVSGKVYPLWNGRTSPALVKVLVEHLGLPSTFHVRCVGPSGEYVPLPPSLTTLLAAHLATSSQERAAREQALRAREEGGNLDPVATLMDLLRRGLHTFGPVVERGPGAILVALQHSHGAATLSVATERPFVQRLTTTLPLPDGRISLHSPAGLGDIIRNLHDPRCGVADVDDAFVIASVGGDADRDRDLAGALARAGGDALVALGRGALLQLSDGALECQMTTSDPHPGAHASAVFRLVRLWEKLMVGLPNAAEAPH